MSVGGYQLLHPALDGLDLEVNRLSLSCGKVGRINLHGLQEVLFRLLVVLDVLLGCASVGIKIRVGVLQILLLSHPFLTASL